MKVLVVAQGRHGGTEQIAAVIAESLRAEGLDVDVRHPAAVLTLGTYDAVVAGSAVYLGRWVRPMRHFAVRFLPELVTKPVWLFSSGPLDDPPFRPGTPTEVAALTTRLRARGHALLNGRLDPALLGRAERLVADVLHAPAGDFRDWETIRGWAAEIAGDLSASPVVSR